MNIKHTVTMLETTQGSDDGIHITQFVKGETYEIGATLFKNFVEGGLIEMAKAEAAKSEPIAEEEKPTGKGKKAKQ